MIQISGSTAVGGIPGSAINGIQTITAISYSTGYGSGLYGAGLYGTSPIDDESSINAITVDTGTDATSAAQGGGSAVTIGTQIIQMDTGLTTLEAGETVTIAGVMGSVGGIPAADINGPRLVRYEFDGDIQFVGIVHFAAPPYRTRWS